MRAFGLALANSRQATRPHGIYFIAFVRRIVMRLSLRRLPLCSALSVFFSTPCVAGAFLQPPDEGLVIVTTSFAEASKAYDGRGKLVPAPSYDKFETRVYVEYGVFEKLTLIAETSHMRFRGASSSRQLDDLQILIEEARAGAPLLLPTGASGPRYAGIGSGWLGARLGLVEWGSVVVSLQASLATASPSARRFLDMARGFQQDARLQFGWPIEVLGMPGFADAQIGYRSFGQRGGEIRADVTFGLRPFDGVLLLAQSFAMAAPGNLGSTFMASQKFQLSAIYDVTPKISVQLGGLAAVRGVNDAAERGVVSALWYRF